MTEYYYRWLHVPTGKSGVRSRAFVSRKAFLDALVKWNRMDSRWIYREAIHWEIRQGVDNS